MADKYNGFHYEESAGYLATALKVRHTAIKLVAHRRAFWIFLAFHLVVKVVFYHGLLSHVDRVHSVELSVGWNELKVVTAMTTFFEVFYTNQSYSRYLRLYDRTRELLNVGQQYVMDLHLAVHRTSRKHVQLASRYFIAQMFVFFFSLSGQPVSILQWDELMKKKLLTREEIVVLKQYEPQKQVLLLTHWCGDVTSCGHALAIDQEKIPQNLRAGMLAKLFRGHALQQELTDVVSLPVPFAYFHLLNLMVVVNILLLAFTMGATESVLSTVIFVCSSLIFMGMMELASDLSDPFGTDEVDFPMGAWLVDWYNSVLHIISMKPPSVLKSDDRWESILSREVDGEVGLQNGGWDDQAFYEAGFNVSIPVIQDESSYASVLLMRSRDGDSSGTDES